MKHDVRLMVEGSLLERLLKQALLQGARFARVQRTGPRSMVFCADAASADILVKLCRKYGLNCRELSRSGFTAARQLICRRWTLLLGVVLCIVICALFLGRLWLVDVIFTGGSGGNAAELQAILKQHGVHIGMPVREIDCDLLGKQILADAGDFSFIGVRAQGIRLLVEAGREQPAPGLYDIKDSRDLVAQRSGVVEEVNVYSGEACVSPGDTVLAGEVLIRGRETIGRDAETRENITAEVGALGKVVARCWFEGSAEAAATRQLVRRSGQSRSACSLQLMGFDFPILAAEPYASCEAETQRVPVVGLFLPLEIVRSTYHETTSEATCADMDALRRQLTSLARADALRQLEDSGIEYEISSEWTDETLNDNTLQIRAVYEIYTDIAAERDALTEEVY